MDHAISNLESYMQSAIDMYRDVGLEEEDFIAEIRAYVNALNSLELYYYGEKRTSLDTVLALHK